MNVKKIATAAALALFVATAPGAMALSGKSKATSGKGKQGSADHQRMARLDRNGDGIITRAEFNGDAAAFDRLDRNHDGVLSQADRAGQGRGKGKGNGQQMRFRGLDTNGDGFVSRSEWRGNDQSFRNHDRNADGVLSGDELRGNGNGR